MNVIKESVFSHFSTTTKIQILAPLIQITVAVATAHRSHYHRYPVFLFTKLARWAP